MNITTPARQLGQHTLDVEDFLQEVLEDMACQGSGGES